MCVIDILVWDEQDFRIDSEMIIALIITHGDKSMDCVYQWDNEWVQDKICCMCIMLHNEMDHIAESQFSDCVN